MTCPRYCEIFGPGACAGVFDETRCVMRKIEERCQYCRNWVPAAADVHRTGFGVCSQMCSKMNKVVEASLGVSGDLKCLSKKEQTSLDRVLVRFLDAVARSLPEAQGANRATLAYCEVPDGSVVTSPYFGCVMFEPNDREE